MKLKILNYNYLIYSDLNFIFFQYLNILLIKLKSGILKIFFPKYFFFILKKNSLNFIFINKFYFSSIITQLFNYIKTCSKFYFFRIKLKGLGYRIKKINKNIYRFFMAYNHFFYLYTPINVYI
jgi:hypothetical protein